MLTGLGGGPVKDGQPYDHALVAASRHPGDPLFGDTHGEEDGRYKLVELTATIAPALCDLDGRDRRILHMRFFKEMTQAEIAGWIGVSPMQISRLICRSLARLEAADEVHACREEEDAMVSGPRPVDGSTARDRSPAMWRTPA